MLSLVVAHDEQLGIGKDLWMPWHLSEDLKHFKKTTLHHKIVFGRTTFEAMKKPLPQRTTYVVTRQKDYTYDHEDVIVVHDLDALLKEYKEKEETLFICGGAKIYAQAIDWVDEMWISKVHGVYEADAYFPTYDTTKFELLSEEEKEGFTLCHYKRKA